ncbi:hypothetical protein [Chitinimonas lacunae]|uniref:SMI1/KNR4 family protein n=1 Tax=Chitinimonas lacunae TaxID=1963018 RepID=A0ABV8MQI3_9NEIS
MAPLLQQQFDHWMDVANTAMEDQDLEEALSAIDSAAATLTAAAEQGIEYWAWIYDYRRYLLLELGRNDEGIAASREAIARINPSQLFPYVAEHRHLRTTLRAAHHAVARHLYHHADNDEQLEQALAHAEQSLTISSPIDEEPSRPLFLATQALILADLSERQPALRPQLWLLLKTMQQAANPYLQEEEELAEQINDADFQRYLADDPLEKSRHGPEGESAAAALVRYETFIAALAEVDPTRASFHELERAGPLPELADPTLPTELVSFLREVGPVSAGEDWSAFWLRAPADLEASGLVDFIKWIWGSRDEIDESYDSEDIEQLNRSYRVFGMQYYDDNQHSYLYFDEAGRFGSIYYDQDNFDALCRDYLDPMLNASPADCTLDELVSALIDETIEDVHESFSEE